jgi:hypothetical protein
MFVLTGPWRGFPVRNVVVGLVLGYIITPAFMPGQFSNPEKRSLKN